MEKIIAEIMGYLLGLSGTELEILRKVAKRLYYEGGREHD